MEVNKKLGQHFTADVIPVKTAVYKRQHFESLKQKIFHKLTFGREERKFTFTYFCSLTPRNLKQ